MRQFGTPALAGRLGSRPARHSALRLKATLPASIAALQLPLHWQGGRWPRWSSASGPARYTGPEFFNARVAHLSDLWYSAAGRHDFLRYIALERRASSARPAARMTSTGAGRPGISSTCAGPWGDSRAK